MSPQIKARGPAQCKIAPFRRLSQHPTTINAVFIGRRLATLRTRQTGIRRRFTPRAPYRPSLHYVQGLPSSLFSFRSSFSSLCLPATTVSYHQYLRFDSPVSSSCFYHFATSPPILLINCHINFNTHSYFRCMSRRCSSMPFCHIVSLPRLLRITLPPLVQPPSLYRRRLLLGRAA